MHKRVVKQLEDKPVDALSGADLLDAVEANGKKKEVNLRDATEAVGAVMLELGVGPEVVEKAKSRLRSQPTFSALIR